MKTLSRREMEALVKSPEFGVWWKSVGETHARAAAMEARLAAEEKENERLGLAAAEADQRAEALLAEAAETEMETANVAAERAAIEDRSMKLVAEFERARTQATYLWARRDAASTVRAKQAAEAEYRAEVERKEAIWTAIETLDEKAGRLDLRLAELRVKARWLKGQADAVFAEAREARDSARKRASECEVMRNTWEVARHAVRRTIHDAAKRFGALVLSEYLYWNDSSDGSRVFCVPAIGESSNPSIFVVDRAQGIERIEHALPTSPLASRPAITTAQT